MIREFSEKDRADFLNMCSVFYSSDATNAAPNIENFEKTFDLILKEQKSNNDYKIIDGYMFEKEGKIAGYGLTSYAYANEIGGFIASLEEIYIKPEFRGQGIGSEYIHYIFDKYKDSGTVKQFFLEVTQSNKRAKKLYEKIGFEELEYIPLVKDNE